MRSDSVLNDRVDPEGGGQRIAKAAATSINGVKMCVFCDKKENKNHTNMEDYRPKYTCLNLKRCKDRKKCWERRLRGGKHVLSV